MLEYLSEQICTWLMCDRANVNSYLVLLQGWLSCQTKVQSFQQ